MELRKTAAKALLWTSLESFTLSGLSLISLLVFARLVSADDFGVVAVALAIVQAVTVPVELLFHDALIQRAELSTEHVNSAHTFSVLMGATFCAACWLLSEPIAGWVGEPRVAAPMRYLSVMPLSAGFGAVLVAMQRRQLTFRTLAVRSVAARLLSAIIAIILAVRGAGLWALVFQSVLLTSLSTLVLWWLAEERPKLRLHWPRAAELLRFGIMATSGQLVAMAIPRTFMVMVGSSLGSEAAGLVSLTFRGLDMLRDLLASAVGHVAMPLLSRMRDDNEGLFRSYNQAVELTTLVTFPLFAGIAVCAREVIEVAFGAQWLPAAPYFFAVALMSLITFSRMYAPALLGVLGAPGAPVLDLLVQWACVVLGMVFVGKQSTSHAMAVWVASLVVTAPLDMWIQRRFSGMGMLRQLRGVPLPAFAVVVMAGAVTLVHDKLPAEWPAALRLLPMVATGALVYPAVVALLDWQLVTRFASFMGHSLKRS